MKLRYAVFAAVLIPAAYGQKQPPDPNQFPETVKVISETKETNDKGDTMTTYRPQPSILNQHPKTQTTVKHHVETYYQCKVQIGDTLYAINGKSGGPGVPLGTFKAKIVNQYMDIYIVDQNGPYVLGFEIVGAEKVSPEEKKEATTATPQ
jgi:hypothetical protein